MGQEANVALTVNADVQFLPTAYRAFSELWQRGRKDWAVDAFAPYMSYLLNCDRKNLEALIICAGVRPHGLHQEQRQQPAPSPLPQADGKRRQRHRP
jgi:hypothetical protein